MKYLAVPYRKDGRDLNGWDCWGCVRYVLDKHAGLLLPTFDKESARQIVRQAATPIWHRQENPDAFDVVCMMSPTRDGPLTLHVGVMVSPTRVLHCEIMTGTVCLPLTHPSIKFRLGAIYRHDSRSLPSRSV